jgi:metallo-beta-lactamase family protein
LIYHLGDLLRTDRIPHLMVFLDSPMAVDATDIFAHHAELLDDDARQRLRAGHSPFDFPGLVLARTSAQSKSINRLRGSCIIMAGSGMCTGGRIKHHLVHNIDRPESTILFVGYQAQGTLGREIADGAPEVRIHGQMLRVRAQVRKISGMSAHADRAALLRWAGHFAANSQPPPRRLFLTHGEEPVSLALAQTLRQQLGWPVNVPGYGETADLD